MKTPTNWNQITIGQFQHINAAIKSYPDNAVSQSVWMLAALTGKSREELLAMDFTREFKPLMAELNWVNTTPLPEQLPAEFEVDGQKYRLVYDIKQRTTGQFIDLAHFAAEPESIITNLHYILAVLCVPGGQKDHSVDFEQRAKIFRDKMTIDIAYPIATFFLKQWLDSLPRILTYLEKRAMKKRSLWKRITGLLSVMAGWLRWIKWPKTAPGGTTT